MTDEPGILAITPASCIAALTSQSAVASCEKIADVSPCLIEQAREKSNARVELCVGTIDRLARYVWSALATWTHRTGTLAIARAACAHTLTRVWTDYVDARRFALGEVRTP